MRKKQDIVIIILTLIFIIIAVLLCIKILNKKNNSAIDNLSYLRHTSEKVTINDTTIKVNISDGNLLVKDEETKTINIPSEEIKYIYYYGDNLYLLTTIGNLYLIKITDINSFNDYTKLPYSGITEFVKVANPEYGKNDQPKYEPYILIDNGLIKLEN